MAEGIIYDMFSQDKNVVDAEQLQRNTGRKPVMSLDGRPVRQL